MRRPGVSHPVVNHEKERIMPERQTLERAEEDRREGKSPSTQAGEFVREEMDHIREGKHGARSTKQAIAIGLSKARRAGVKLSAPKKGRASARTWQRARRASQAAKKGRKPSRKRSAATRRALRREGRSAASRPALARQARSAAARRTRAERSRSARMGVRHRASAGRGRTTGGRAGGSRKRR